MLSLRPQYIWVVIGCIPTVAILAIIGYPVVKMFLQIPLDTSVKDYYWQKWWWTITQAAITTVICLVLGIPAAWWLSRYRIWCQEVVHALVLLPFVTPVMVASLGFLALFGGQSMLGISLYGTMWLVLLANVFYNYPVVLRLFMVRFAALPEAPLAAARMLGSSPLRVFWRVVLPLIAPTIASAGVIVFLYSISGFGVALFLGAGRWTTLEVEIYTLINQGDVSLAMTLGVWQFANTAVLTIISLRSQHWLAINPTSVVLRPKPHGFNAVMAWGWVIFSLTLCLAPLLAVVWRACIGPDGLTFDAFSALFAPSRRVFAVPVLTVISNTMIFSSVTVILTLFIVLIISFAIFWFKKYRFIYEIVGLLPLFLSPLILGMSFIISYPSTVWLLLVAYLIQALPIALRSSLVALDTVPSSWVSAGQVLGSTPWRVMWRVIMPNIAPGLRSGMALAYATVVGELTATVLLSRPQWMTLVGLMQEKFGRPGQLAEVCALAVILLAITLVGVVIIGGRQYRVRS
jgi:thiamine transport system permease protein